MNHKHDDTASTGRVASCLQHPGDWFDAKRRTYTRQQCLNCPTLQPCTESALHRQPSYGMWAGVWIDGDFPAKRHLLGLPAQPPPDTKSLDHQPVTPPAAAPVATRAARPGRRVRVRKLLIAAPAPAIAQQITARASGHCEIMAPACTYEQAAIFSRRRRAPHPLGSPADAIAACRNCIDLIEHTDIPTALDLGYLVDPRSTTSTTPMLWRQHRWVFLDTHGHLHDTTDLTVTHHAS